MFTDPTVYNSYDDMLADPQWQKKLYSLNSSIRDALRKQDAPAVMSGNLFYDHLQPRFWKEGLLPDCDRKRRRLFSLARHANTFFEVGVNGGHSMFLALSANPDLLCTGVDLCKQLAPHWGAVHIYVEVAVEWLRQEFPGRITFLKGDCLTEIPEFVDTHRDYDIDLAQEDYPEIPQEKYQNTVLKVVW